MATMDSSSSHLAIVGSFTTGDRKGVVTFLTSQSASYVTGSTVRIDGGLIPSI